MPGIPFPVDFAYDFLKSPDPIFPAGGTTTTTIDTNGTFINSSGLITQKTVNVWPLDYDPATLQPRGRPIWEARTNLVPTSVPNSATWTANASTITNNAITAPDGTATAAFLNENTDVAQFHFIWRAVTLADSSAYVVSAFVKPQNRTWTAITLLKKDGSLDGAYYNLADGVIGSSVGGATTKTITAYPNGWYLVSFVCPTCGVGGSAPRIEIYAAEADGDAQYNGASGSGLYAWGADVQLGSFATPYIPTAGAAVTRAADNVSIAVGSWFNASEGVFAMEFIPNAPAAYVNNQYMAEVSNGSTAERYIFTRNSTSGTSGFLVQDGGAVLVIINSVASMAQNSVSRLASAYKLNDFAASTNGATAVTDTSGTLPTVNTMSIGWSGSSSSAYLNGWERKLYYSRTRQADALLQQVRG